eukprot:174451_1
MLARGRTQFIRLVRTYDYNIRCVSRSNTVSSMNDTEIAKYIESTDNINDTLQLNWHAMTDGQKQYFEHILKHNEPIKSISETEEQTPSYIERIRLNTVDALSNKDALRMSEWLGAILASSNNKIKHLNIDLSKNENHNKTDDQIIDAQCIDNLCEGILNNPNNATELESLEFEAIALNTESVESILDAIKVKCKYCEYLSLANCNLNGDEVADVVCSFYYRNDYSGLRNTSLCEIDLYDNTFASPHLFHNHALVALNRNIKKFLRLAIKSYGDFLRVENILIHTNDPYFRFCILPNLRMTMGTISKEYASYCRDVVRYNRRSWNEETIKSMRKMAIITWFALTLGVLFGDIIKRGKKSWWFRVPEILGLNSVKEKKRDTYHTKQKKEETWWKRTFR